MGGAVTNLAAVKHELAVYDPAVVQGSVLDRDGDRPPDRAATGRATPTPGGTIVGLQPKRAEVILAGACIVRTVMDKLGKDTLDGQRPRPPPRRARRAVRTLTHGDPMSATAPPRSREPPTPSSPSCCA